MKTPSSNKTLWQSKGETGLSPAVMRFLAGDDVILDQKLIEHDINGTRAHINGLHRIGLLSDDDHRQLREGLAALQQAIACGQFILDDRFEDSHSAIEWFLTEHCGEAGQRVHTGRSRNDQVLTSTRLYLRSQLKQVHRACQALAELCLSKAEQHQWVAMPGYTHLQQAMPMTLGFWFAGFAESMLDNMLAVSQAETLINASPLGTAAGLGVPLPLDRDAVAAELAFDRLQINPLSAQNSRGKYELLGLNACHFCLLDIRRMMWDLSLFASSEFGFVRMSSGYATGSSIMPNKVNPDVVELMRASVATLEGCIHQIQTLQCIPSGYQRDLQLTKGALIRGLETSVEVMQLAHGLVDGLMFDHTRMREAMGDDMLATDRALRAVAAGESFREAYRSQKPESLGDEGGDSTPVAEALSMEQSIRDRISLGACGNLALDRLSQRLKKASGSQ